MKTPYSHLFIYDKNIRKKRDLTECGKGPKPKKAELGPIRPVKGGQIDEVTPLQGCRGQGVTFRQQCIRLAGSEARGGWFLLRLFSLLCKLDTAAVMGRLVNGNCCELTDGGKWQGDL